MKKALLTLVAATALAAGGVVVTPSTAEATGTVHVKCTHYNTATGYSAGGAAAFTTNAGVCGQSKVRIFYKIYAGSPTYYTGWSYSSSTAIRQNPGNIVLGANHGVANPAPAYSSAKSFTS